jgi:hypothetical protein
MTFFRQTEKVLHRLRLKGDPFTLAEIAELGRIRRAGASQMASRLIAAGLVERLPIRGTYALAGWQERPWADFMIFRAWLKLNPGLGWIDASEAPWFKSSRLQSRARHTRWRVGIISLHAERVLPQYYNVKRAKYLPAAGTSPIKGIDIVIARPGE